MTGQEPDKTARLDRHRFQRRLYPATPGATPGREPFDAIWADESLQPPSDATTIADLRSQQAFLLMGELGVGKTWLFENEVARLQSEGHQHVRFVRLGEFSDTTELEAESFGHSDIAKAAASGIEADLFLDSLDQGLIQIPRLHHWLARRFRDLHNRPHVRIRVSSRILPEALALATGLAALYRVPPSQIVFYVGALTKEEIVKEAVSRGLDGQKFVRVVGARNAELLATHPLTLDLLLSQYEATQKLAPDLVELYRAACRRLTEEHEANQLAQSPAHGEFAYTLTGRIAAVMAMAGKPLISLGPTANRPETSIGVEDVTSLPDEVNGKSVEIGDRQVRYVLTNALFQAGSQGTYRWSHIALQDFMAAEWAAKRLHPDQIQGLLVHPLDPRGQIRPDLEELAAWLAGMIPSIRHYLVRVQPLVLLMSQSQAGARVAPAELLGALLTPENSMRVRWRNIRDVRLRRLRSAETPSLLRPVLAPIADQEVQWLALAIIRQLGLKGFDAELVELLTNPAIAEFVAVSAGLALEATGSTLARRQLADRLLGADAPQLPDEIKAVLLRATWPKFTSGATLFRVFTPPTDGVLGLYDTLPADWILKELGVPDLPPALAWVASERLSGFVPTNRRQLVEGIMGQAAQYLGDAAVRSALVGLMDVLSRSEIAYRELDLFAPLYEDISEARGVFVDAMKAAVDPEEFVKGMYWQIGPIFSSLGWLLTQRRNARLEPQRAAWLWLIERIPPRNDTELRRLRALAHGDPALQPIAKKTRKPAHAPRFGSSRSRLRTKIVSFPADNGRESLRHRLTTALDHLETNVQARLDVADLVWKSEGEVSAMESLWMDLNRETRLRVDAFFARQLEV